VVSVSDLGSHPKTQRPNPKLQIPKTGPSPIAHQPSPRHVAAEGVELAGDDINLLGREGGVESELGADERTGNLEDRKPAA